MLCGPPEGSSRMADFFKEIIEEEKKVKKAVDRALEEAESDNGSSKNPAGQKAAAKKKGPAKRIDAKNTDAKNAKVADSADGADSAGSAGDNDNIDSEDTCSKSEFARGLGELEYGVDKFYYTIAYILKKIGHVFLFVIICIRRLIFKINPEKKRVSEKRRVALRRKARQIRREIIKRDKAAAAAIIHFVNKFDKKSDIVAERAGEKIAEHGEKYNLAKEWADLNKTKLLRQFGVFLLIIFVCVGCYNYFTAFEYFYNGRAIGYTKEQQDVLRICDLVAEKLSQEHNAEIKIDKANDISFEKVWVFGKHMDNKEEVLTKMSYMHDLSAVGCGIYIDGHRVAIVDNEDTANKILEKVKNTYTLESDTTKYESVGFAEVIETKGVETRLGRIENSGDVVQKLLTGSDSIETYTVASGDTLSGIAKKFNTTVDKILATNPNLNASKLSIGEVVTITEPEPMLTVQTVEISTIYEPLDYETEYIDTNNIYEGETQTLVAGEYGERTVQARIVKNNGKEISRVELSSVVSKEPVKAVIYRGTKKMPPKQGTGTFIYPVTGARLSSKYGPRWGRMHNGIDLACPTGTYIRASDGGTVTFAGYQRSYGYKVEIDHGGGYTTLYAHCSAIFVSVGEKVYQGQHIANVGSTGNSTGPHCHFEIHYLGEIKNPLNYL